VRVQDRVGSHALVLRVEPTVGRADHHSLCNFGGDRRVKPSLGPFGTHVIKRDYTLTNLKLQDFSFLEKIFLTYCIFLLREIIARD
jgi:hypothetical protein